MEAAMVVSVVAMEAATVVAIKAATAVAMEEATVVAIGGDGGTCWVSGGLI